MIERGIQEFVLRDWETARKAKDEYWGERVARLGPLESFRISEELRQQALLLDLDGPHPSDRIEDVRAHAHLAEILRAGSASSP